jgi:DNA-binding CsgD family transcriptional regulator
MGGRVQSPVSLPSWIGVLGAPVWVSDSSGKIGYLNERAETLLGVAAETCLGRPCHEVVAGRDAEGRPHCGPGCPIAARARLDTEIEPFEMRVGSSRATARWIQVLIIKIAAAERKRPWLVHCAISRDKAHRIEHYLAKVAARTAHDEADGSDSRRQDLTSREFEILRLLAEDHDLYTIADELHISYVTVRNHVQHVLSKLGVHSIMEAVACYLLLDEGPAHTDGRHRGRAS